MLRGTSRGTSRGKPETRDVIQGCITKALDDIPHSVFTGKGLYERGNWQYRAG